MFEAALITSEWRLIGDNRPGLHHVSIIDEAIVGLGEILAINNLPYYDLLVEDVFTNDENATENRMGALLMLALKVLPRLPYYLAADFWRLNILENNESELAQSWWEMR